MTTNIKTEIAKLDLNPDRPLVIVDADEVLVLFAEHFSQFLRNLGWHLNLKGYRLDDAIEHIRDGYIADKSTYQNLINSFIRTETIRQPEAPGASKALRTISQNCQIIILTNVPKASKEDRIMNLSGFGINYPLIVNTGYKGEAIREIRNLVNNTCFFIDDNPYQIASAADKNPSIYRFHFTACKLVQKTMPYTESATHRPNSWEDIVALINEILSS